MRPDGLSELARAIGYTGAYAIATGARVDRFEVTDPEFRRRHAWLSVYVVQSERVAQAQRLTAMLRERRGAAG
jgi:hypothetical protein